MSSSSISQPFKHI